MLKKSCKATGFNFNSHKCNTEGMDILQEGWMSMLRVFAVLLAGIFQYICPGDKKLFFKR